MCLGWTFGYVVHNLLIYDPNRDRDLSFREEVTKIILKHVDGQQREGRATTMRGNWDGKNLVAQLKFRFGLFCLNYSKSRFRLTTIMEV